MSCASSKDASISADDALAEMEKAFDRQKGELTPEEEYYLGRAVAANILEQYPPYLGNSGLTGYLNAICGALTVHSEKPEIFNGYHVRILDSDEINAFATSGGHIFIARGLLAAANSEDALAAVIAHEVAHVQLRHAAKQIEDMRFVQKLSEVAAQATEALRIEKETEVFSDSVSTMVDNLMTKGYSQTQEFDADSFALSLLAGAGYSPSALIDVLTVLEKQQPNQTGIGFDKTHPSPQMRLANAAAKVGNYQVEDTRSFRTARYQAAVQPK
ncbi:MAG: M48 family metalloprotease [Spirochaetaceae bacterium]|nr:M48 family metalloprotease [Spirochaetaceae bacterium]